MDEPIFVLLARDPLAPQLVRLWAVARALAANTPQDISAVDAADKCADSMEKWAKDHPDHGPFAK